MKKSHCPGRGIGTVRPHETHRHPLRVTRGDPTRSNTTPTECREKVWVFVFPIPKIKYTSRRITVRSEEKTAGKDPQKTRNTIMETQNKVQDVPWYETGKFSTLQEKQLQKKCDSVSSGITQIRPCRVS